MFRQAQYLTFALTRLTTSPHPWTHQAWVGKVAALLQDKHAPLRAAAVEYLATLYVTLPSTQTALFHFLTSQEVSEQVRGLRAG
jgi:hypothetical protein